MILKRDEAFRAVCELRTPIDDEYFNIKNNRDIKERETDG